MVNENTPSSLREKGRNKKLENRLDRRELGDATRKKMLEAASTEFDIVIFEWATGEIAKEEAERLGVSLNLESSLDLSGGLI